MHRPVTLTALVVLALGCQTYDFERVVPLAVAQTTEKTLVASKRLKPNVMLLVDNSGSMLYPIDPANPACPSGCGFSGAACPASCPTRVSELKGAMGSLLQASGAVARLGLTVYPSGGCEPAKVIDVPFPAPTPSDTGTDAALTQVAQAVNAKLQALVPTGGTPTGASLQFLGTYPGLNDATDQRDDLVLLLTDGLPNCNGANTSNVCQCDANACGSCASGAPACAAQVAACRCTTSSCAGGNCAIGCLDRDGSVQRVRELRQRGVKTIVVGFGADLGAGDGPDVLNALAAEGGYARECPNGSDAECGAGNTCAPATRLCTRGFYQAANGTELAEALRNIWDRLPGEACVYRLPARPSDPRYLSVIVDEQSLVAGPQTFAYDSGRNEVTFQGDTCNRLKSSSTADPVTVEFRIVEQF